MSIIIALTIIILVGHGAMAIARAAVDAVATAVGLLLFARAMHINRRILAMRTGSDVADFGRRPNRAERRLLATGLKLAIWQTELLSLFPHIALRCQRLLGPGAASL